MVNDHQQTLAERVSILETQALQSAKDTGEIKAKLDLLIDLKSRGLGALWFIALLLGSGLLGFISNLLKKA